ncbi:MAG: hypothetical protein WC657_04540 [Candidatus Paceibacterota bacterium]|jgi:hypothetical protein
MYNESVFDEQIVYRCGDDDSTDDSGDSVDSDDYSDDSDADSDEQEN